jgi:uncharacterized protein
VTYNDHARWKRLEHDWYASGRAYRDLEKIDGTPNPIFDRWIAHPSYDPYWQSVIPFRDDFARIKIPVLNTAGYYYGGPGAAVYYFTQHNRYNPKAEHYLLIGPYDHVEAQRGTGNAFDEDTEEISGYKRDPVALINITDLRYEWFDYVLRNAPKPAILQEKVNYEVTGANVWKHAPSFSAMANRRQRFYFTRGQKDESGRLAVKKPARQEFINQSIDFADRSDVDKRRPGGAVLDKDIDNTNGLVFVSEPFPKAPEVSGLFAGQLDLVTNKRDFDFGVALFELTPHGEYMQLAPFWSRASYVADLSQRRLLTPGKRQRLTFTGVRLMSHQFAPGGRLVAVLSIIKEPGREINYGTGRQVIGETISDAKEPLAIKWYNDSYIDVPVK